MKSILFFCVSLLFTASFVQAKELPSRSEMIKKALESQSSCQNFVRIDDKNIYLGFGYYRQNFENPRSAQPGFLRVVPIETPALAYNLKTEDSAIGAIAIESQLYVLTYSGLELWDLNSRERVAIYSTLKNKETVSLDYRQHATGFARYQNQLIISHGRLGLSFFDLASRKVTKSLDLVTSQSPLESEATDVAISGKYAYVLMDSFTLVESGPSAFQGLAVVDVETHSIVGEIGSMGPGADSLVLDKQSLIVSFWGMPIWKYNLAEIQGRKMPEPENRVWKFPVFGHPTGKADLDQKYYYTCFKKMSVKGDQPSSFHPMALDRRILMLD